MKWITLSLLLAHSLWAKPACQIISVGGAHTEWIHEFNAQECLVGVDATSTYPKHQITQLGYYRALSSEGILALQPKFMVYREDAGPPPVIQQIKATGLKTLALEVAYEPQGILKNMSLLAQELEVDPKPHQQKFQQGMNQVQAKIKAQVQTQKASHKKGLFIYARGGGTLMAAGQKTGGHSMLKLAGLNNASRHFGYKPLSTESVIAMNPHFLVFTNDGLKSLGGVEALKKHPIFAQVSAIAEGRIITVDESLFLSFGPRLPQALENMIDLWIEKVGSK